MQSRPSAKYVDVVVRNRVDRNSSVFTYRLPESLSDIPVGAVVSVPFGRSHVFAVIVKISVSPPDFATRMVKRQISDFVLPPKLIDLASHIAEYYYCSIGQAVFAMIPSFVTKNIAAKKEKIIRLGANYPDPLLIKRYSQQWNLFQYILHHPETAWSGIKNDFSSAALKRLVDKKYLVIEVKETDRLIKLPDQSKNSLPDLMPAQDKIFRGISRVINSEKPRPVLLFGRTGSGKTEIYLRCAQQVIQQGKSVIILVPEIALVPQTIARFYDVFGDRLAVYHSQLSEGERRDQWWRIYRGEASVVIGSRSALFSPLPNLGLIIIDEEHEYSYKQDSTPRYHAVDVAVEYSRLTNSGLILGSATPRVECFWQAKKGKFHLFKLTHTIRELLQPDRKRKPQFAVADLRQEFAGRNYSTVSLPLHVAIQNTLERQMQVMLFLNRRGYTSYVFCRLCGYVAKCPSCNVSLTLHINSPGGQLICHHCGYQTPPAAQCPQCHSPSIKYYGAGTQKVERDIRELFPDARILRMDHDTTRTKDSHRQIFDKFRRHQADILIGTQMIAKGWNIPQADLIGIINADAGFHLPDFRATEKNFALMMQIIGRVGRFDTPGQVVIQTYEPENPLFDVLQKEAYQLFAFSELIERRKSNLPPFTQMVRLVYEHPSHDRCRRSSLELFAKFNRLMQTKKYPIDQLLGPAPAFFSRINNKYRWHIILQGQNLQNCLDIVPNDWIIDVDPLSLL